MIDEVIFGIKFKIKKEYLEQWCNECGYCSIEDFKKNGNIEVAYRIYCYSYSERER